MASEKENELTQTKSDEADSKTDAEPRGAENSAGKGRRSNKSKQGKSKSSGSKKKTGKGKSGAARKETYKASKEEIAAPEQPAQSAGEQTAVSGGETTPAADGSKSGQSKAEPKKSATSETRKKSKKTKSKKGGRGSKLTVDDILSEIDSAQRENTNPDGDKNAGKKESVPAAAETAAAQPETEAKAEPEAKEETGGKGEEAQVEPAPAKTVAAQPETEAKAEPEAGDAQKVPEPSGKSRRGRRSGKKSGLGEVEALLDEAMGQKKAALAFGKKKKKKEIAAEAAEPLSAEQPNPELPAEGKPRDSKPAETAAAEIRAVEVGAGTVTAETEAEKPAEKPAETAAVETEPVPEPEEPRQKKPEPDKTEEESAKKTVWSAGGKKKQKKKTYKKGGKPSTEEATTEPVSEAAGAEESAKAEPEPADAESGAEPAREAETSEAVSEEKPKKKARALWVAVILILLCALGAGGYLYWLSGRPPVIEAIEVADELNEDNTVTMTVQVSTPYPFQTELWCALGEEGQPPEPGSDAWKKMEDGVCRFDVEAGDHAIYAMDSRGNLCVPGSETVEINECVSVTIDKEKLYLPLEGKDILTASLFILGDVPDTVTWSSNNERVATVDQNGIVRAVAEGEAEIVATSADGKTAETYVMVTDLIKLPNINTTSKPMLVGNPYTEEQAELLDEILATKVEQAGYGTRAGAVAAARFLALEFEYRVPYFFENGRLSPHPGRPYCDGEGRYYHQGLYLTESKFEDLSYVRFGPATWGQLLLNYETKYAFVAGARYPNGLDCSGFVCWCLINGGTDVGDMGAGDEYGDNDLCDLAEKKWITTELMQSDEIQVGDLIAEDGHMAIIIGLTEDRIYIAESLVTSVRVTNYPRTNAVRNGPYTYVIPMGDVYAAEGNVTSYWEIEEPEA